MRIWEINAQVDVVEIAKRVSMPTLVLHCPGDRVVPPDEGRLVAKMIPGAHFVDCKQQPHVLLAATGGVEEFFNHVSVCFCAAQFRLGGGHSLTTSSRFKR